MTQFNATQVLVSIDKEFFQVGEEVRISVRGLSRLTSVSRKAIQKYLERNGVKTVIVHRATGDVLECLEDALDNDNGAATRTISLDDAAVTIFYYAAESDQVSDIVKLHSSAITKAFMHRGMEAWVKDVLGMHVDSTASNADINALVGLYPGLANLTEQRTETMQAYISVRQYLTDVRDLADDSNLFEWMHARLPMMASQTYQSLKQRKPEARLCINKHGHLCMMKTYLYSELAMLDMAYEKLLLAFSEYQRFLALDWVQMDGE